MESWLANIVTKLKQCRDALAAMKPGTALDKAADLLSLVESALRQASEFISIGGPYLVNSVETDQAKSAVADLTSMKAEFESLLAAPVPAAAVGAPFQAIHEMGLMTPGVQRPILSLLVQVLAKVLTKVGQTPAPVAATPPAAKEKKA